jgi:hypothetical protein
MSYDPNYKPREIIPPVADLCIKYGYNPIEALIILRMETQDGHLKYKCDKEIASYLYQKKPTEQIIRTENLLDLSEISEKLDKIHAK